MAMFPKFTDAAYLEALPSKYGDVQSAVAKCDGRYVSGFCWAFWLADDPRTANGICPLAKYRCYESGGSESRWELIE